jgi:hypothetical protein
MSEDELKVYQGLTKIQKDMVDSLLNLGFTHKYNSTYERHGWGEIKVTKYSRWSDLLKKVHEQGKDQKQFEFQRVLGV